MGNHSFWTVRHIRICQDCKRSLAYKGYVVRSIGRMRAGVKGIPD